MYYLPRDPGSDRIYARKKHSCYGMGLGIMILDEVYPGFPGDVRNASAFPYPIQYEIIRNVDIQRLVFEEDKSPCLAQIIQAAKNLEQMGCRAIAAECGYFAYFQKEVAGAVDVPVFMSSLLQIPLIQQIIGPQKQVGIFCGAKEALLPEHLINVGVDPNSNIVVCGGLDEYNIVELQNLWYANVRPEIPTASYLKVEEAMVNAVKDMVKRYPKIGAIMLECTGFQPFARAIQRAVDLPVFSWGTLLDYAYSVVNHRDYYGHV